MRLQITRDTFRLAERFTISRGSRTQAEVLTVELHSGDFVGRGECVPYARYDETLDSVESQINELSADFANGLDRSALQTLLAAGAARNAVDCALWDLEAKHTGTRVWQLAGLQEPGTLTSAYTLSLDTPHTMREKARQNAARPLLKIKLGGGETDIARLRAVREGAPDSVIIVDANEGWSQAEYEALAPLLLQLGVAMVEQPFAAGDDALLAEMERPLPVCADESCHDVGTLPKLAGKYDVVNIKLDKTGGLTEALALEKAAREQGFEIMVGCMIGSSLAMAPATLVSANARYVDLDGPLLLAEDRSTPLHYDGSVIYPPDSGLWG